MKEFATRFVPDMAEQCEVRLFISGHQGGDAGHGADATIEFVPQSGACMLEVELESGEKQCFDYAIGEQIKKVSFSMLGDWEIMHRSIRKSYKVEDLS